MAARGNGRDVLLHEPQTDTDYNFFALRLSSLSTAASPVLELFNPELELRTTPNSTLDARDLRLGAWSGILKTFPATTVVEWQLNELPPNPMLCPDQAAAMAVAPPKLWLPYGTLPSFNAPASSAAFLATPIATGYSAYTYDFETEGRRASEVEPPVELFAANATATDAYHATLAAEAATEAALAGTRNVSACGEPYRVVAESYVIEVSSWVRAGADVTSGVSAGADLIEARGYPENVETIVQYDDGATQLSFRALPDLAQRNVVARAADDRIGFWTTSWQEMGSVISDDGLISAAQTNRRVRVAQRWHLAPDTSAPPRPDGLHTPIRPITFHIDPAVPPEWRPAVRRGVENWNAAFEQAGWHGAMIALEPTDAAFPEDYSAGDSRYASITWSVSQSSVYAVGVHTTDPRTAEILDGDIMFAHAWIGYWLKEYHEQVTLPGAEPGEDGTRPVDTPVVVARQPPQSLDERLLASQAAAEMELGDAERPPRGSTAEKKERGGGRAWERRHRHAHSHQCKHGEHIQREVALAMAALDLDGADPLAVPSARALIEAQITEVVMHEVGHTIGLRHNFKASAAYSWDQLANESFVSEHGFTSSVMDYTPAFIPSNRSLQSPHATGFVSTVVGAYDKHAIEYGYRFVPDEVSGVQPAELATLAARGAERSDLSFSTDEDGPRLSGLDPLTNVYDLGNDPIGFYEDRLALAQRLLATAANRTVLPGQSWTKLFEAVKSFTYIAQRSGTYVAKYVGGTHFSKAHKGDPGAKDSMVAVSPAEQARALQLALQILSQSFWMPAADALRTMPQREGQYCDEIEQYCLGLTVPALLARIKHIREQVLLQLLQSYRLNTLSQQEWQADFTFEAPPSPPPIDSLHTVWVDQPASVPSVDRLAARPSVSALLETIDEALALPNASAILSIAPSVAKMTFEMQRIWVGLLLQLSKQESEQGAAAVQLLHKLDADATSRLATYNGTNSLPFSGAALRAHLLWLRHALDGWVHPTSGTMDVVFSF